MTSPTPPLGYSISVSGGVGQKGILRPRRRPSSFPFKDVDRRAVHELLSEGHMMQRSKPSREKFRAWVTKYALSTGVFVVDAELNSDISEAMITFRRSGSTWDEHAHGKDWHRTREAATARVEELRQKKIKSLEQQLATLKALSPAVPE